MALVAYPYRTRFLQGARLMSKLALIRDPKFQEHLTPDTHPESPQRLQAIDNVIHKSALEGSIKELQPRPATEEELLSVHSDTYIHELEKDSSLAQKRNGLVQLDSDTFMSPKTYDTAKLAAGAGLVAVDAVSHRNGHTSSFVAVRPPGHHALKDKPMGFCLFNNIAVAAKYAQKALGAKRVFIVDWDVHHGNGTQALFYNDPSIFFTSFHQYPFWPPDSGWYTEDGDGEGKGFNMNIPLPAGTGDRGYLAAWDALVNPVCAEFEPDLIMLSAGYDAHNLDPLGQQRISTAGFAMLSQRLSELTRSGDAKIVCFLEGGYNTRSMSESAVATMRVLNADGESELGQVHSSYLVEGPVSGKEPITNDRSPDQVDERIKDVRKHFSKYWKALR